VVRREANQQASLYERRPYRATGTGDVI
jgi:hypothetical protein